MCGVLYKDRLVTGVAGCRLCGPPKMELLLRQGQDPRSHVRNPDTWHRRQLDIKQVISVKGYSDQVVVTF